MKKILIINGHPDKGSFCKALADNYKNGVIRKGAECKVINLSEIEFHPILNYGYRKRTELEPDLIKAQQDIKWADHITFVYPTWWGTQPALLKGFIERVFLPNFAFSYRKDSLMWDKLLEGKSARLIVTMDTPNWYYNWIYRKPGHNAFKKGTLQFCGIKPVKISTLGPVKKADERKRNKWLEKVEQLGYSLN